MFVNTIVDTERLRRASYEFRKSRFEFSFLTETRYEFRQLKLFKEIWDTRSSNSSRFVKILFQYLRLVVTWIFEIKHSRGIYVLLVLKLIYRV